MRSNSEIFEKTRRKEKENNFLDLRNKREKWKRKEEWKKDILEFATWLKSVYERLMLKLWVTIKYKGKA